MIDRTERQYTRLVSGFLAWCATKKLDPLLAAPADIEAYLCTRISPNTGNGTVHVISAAIDRWFVRQGYDLPPTRSERVRRLRRVVKAPAGVFGSLPLSVGEIAAMIDICPDTLIGLRDRALFDLATSSGLRRAKLVTLTVGAFRQLKLDTPHVETWLARMRITAGPVLRTVHRGGHVRPWGLTPQIVSLRTKFRVAQIGLDPAHYSADSLRHSTQSWRDAQ